MLNVVITGVSSGIGNTLAQSYLEQGHTVYGVSRTAPINLDGYDNFHFQSLDLSELDSIDGGLSRFLIHDNGVSKIDYLYLHAGQFSYRIASVQETPQSEIDYFMRLHVWSNKAILDILLGHGVEINTCMFSASIAGVRARAGNNSYALSKAALLMLAKLYALENPEIFFAVLGLCLVDTPMTRKAASLPVDSRFPEVKMLMERSFQPGYAVSASERVQKIRSILEAQKKIVIESGDFLEIRSL